MKGLHVRRPELHLLHFIFPVQSENHQICVPHGTATAVDKHLERSPPGRGGEAPGRPCELAIRPRELAIRMQACASDAPAPQAQQDGEGCRDTKQAPQEQESPLPGPRHFWLFFPPPGPHTHSSEERDEQTGGMPTPTVAKSVYIPLSTECAIWPAVTFERLRFFFFFVPGN